MKKTVFWLVVFGFAATIGFARSFPDGFQGTWKRAQYASTLSFTGNTVKESNRDVFWTLQNVDYGDEYRIVSSGTGAAINSGGDDKNYVIKVTGNFQLAASSYSTLVPVNIKVLIYIIII